MRKLRRLVSLALLALLGVAVLGYAFLSVQRYRAIRNILSRTEADRAEGQINALLAYVGSPDVDLAEKNRVIWVLGELRDERALPTLVGLQRSETCDHSRFVCQREVRKAIAKIEGEIPNPFFWQKFDGT